MDNFFFQGLCHPPPNLKKSGELLLLLAPHQFEGDDTALHQVKVGRMQITFKIKKLVGRAANFFLIHGSKS